jgi:hypothetical protein
MPGGRPPVIEDEGYCQRFVAKVDEMREIGLKWTVIAKRLDVSDSFLLKWRRKIDYDDPFRQSDVSDADLDDNARHKSSQKCSKTKKGHTPLITALSEIDFQLTQNSSTNSRFSGYGDMPSQLGH